MAKRGTVKQIQVLELLVQGFSRKEIADKIGCSVKTVDAVKGDPELRQIYYQRCNDQVEQLLPLALRRLKDIITDDKQQGSVHIAAIKEILERSHLRELTDDSNKPINVVISYE